MHTGNTPLAKLFKMDMAHKKALEKIGLITAQDLFSYFPIRYSHISLIKNIDSVANDEYVTIYGVLKKIELTRTFKTHVLQARGTVIDISNNQIELVWFNQHYIAKIYKEGQFVKVSGKVTI